jgi:hypothetical protein
MLQAYFDDPRWEVAEELAFAFNPLELPYWQVKVRTGPTGKALPDGLPAR